MADDKKIEIFEHMPVSKAVLKLGIPSVLASLVMILYNLADTYFVGMLNDPIESSAVTLAAPVLLAFNAVNNLFGVGSSSMMSRALGAKDYETVRKSSAFGFYCALICGFLFSLLTFLLRGSLLRLLGADSTTSASTLEYLRWTVVCGAIPSILNVVMAYLIRAEGSALHASVGTMCGCALNIVLDPIFILPWGFNMGAAGAGCATFISNCVACLYFFVVLAAKRGKTFVCIHPKAFRPNGKIVRGVCGVGIPASIQNLLNVTGMTVLNNALAVYGSEAVAAMGIAHKTTMIPMYISMGITQGVMPLIGYNYAAQNVKRMKKSVVFTAELGMSFMIVAAAVYYVFAGPITRVFMSNAEIVHYGTAFMRGLSLAQPFLAMDFLAVAVFQACGMGSRSLLFAVLRKIVLEIPALLLLNKLFPIYGTAYAQLCAEVILAAAAVICLIRIFRKLEAEAGNAN